MRFMHLTQVFGFLNFFGGFSKLMMFLQNFWVGFFKTSCIASHLHYNNIFMHYRCVLYLLQCCVLVGLNWAEPMMYLLCFILLVLI